MNKEKRIAELEQWLRFFKEKIGESSEAVKDIKKKLEKVKNS
jgi:hypothetical protein